MAIENALEKTNRINLLFDFYQKLLTEKQQTFLKLYFHDNYSLGEIAEEFSISRQAVNEHIKRAEHMLKAYEDKLHLLDQYEHRKQYIQKIDHLLNSVDDENKDRIKDLLDKIIDLE
jgi:predicted DNA-binding protein YlxM (UPF0122 family)